MKRANRMKLAFRRGAARAMVLAPLTFLLVAGAGCPSLFEGPPQRAVKVKQAVPGRNGARTVNAADTVVNAYVALQADAAQGATSITVTNIADLSVNFSQALAQGDLLLIVQMQGATIETTANDATYGAVTALGSAGLYEFVGVESVAGNVITLACSLRHAYTSAGRTQVVRVPQYTTLTIAAIGSITAPAWNGITGGVVAVHAQTTVQLDGAIDVSAKGFRGGAVDNASRAATTAVALYRYTDNQDGAEKGESIAGYQTDYTTGRYGRGAPANGGGGGNSHNAGGGGGANAGNPAGWAGGQGVMLDSVTGETAWTLDPGYAANSNARTNAEGGGRGGYSYSSVDLDPTAVGPGDATWGGNNRREVGGLGGRPLASSPGTRLFMGGGGGAGDRNDGSAGCAGGNGGGLVFIIAGSVAGDGSILANGGSAPAAPGSGTGGDAPGGGGGGGTVVVRASTLSAFNISVDGGAGGNQTGSTGDAEVEGPGGGGGGGYIALAGTGPTLSAAGGLGGTTNRAGMSEFPSDGATAGHAGITDGSATAFFYCGAPPTTTIATKPTDPTSDTTGDFTFTNTSTSVTYECNLDDDGWDSCDPTYATTALDDGEHTLLVRATDSLGNVELTPPSYTWTVDTVPPNTLIDLKPALVSADATPDFTFDSNETPVTYECNLDGAGWQSCSASYTPTTPLGNGPHTLSVQATDEAGNVDPTPVTYEWEVDSGLPLTTIATHPLEFSNDPTGDFTFTNIKTPVTYECNLDDGGWVDCDPTYATAPLDDGEHTLLVRSTDETFVVEDPPVSFTWTIDTVLPETTIEDVPSDPTSDSTGVFSFTSTEAPPAFECSLDGGDWIDCDADFSTGALPDGRHTIDVRAVDQAGNVDDTPATYAWTIDTTGIDGGVLDGGGSEAGSGADSGPVIIVDAEAIDSEGIDAGTLDVQAMDAEKEDVAAVVPDVPGRRDVLPDVPGPVMDAVARDDAAPDLAPATGPEPGPDTAPATGPEPGPDTAPPVVNPDTAPPVGMPDAAPPIVTDLKALGGGFCAVSPSRTTSPAAFMLLALAGMALLRRRRR